MRTLIAIVIGLLLLAVVVAIAVRQRGTARSKTILGFIVVWFVLCVVDTVLGVSAGYSLGEELLIHLLIFVVPAAAALVAARRLVVRR